MPEISVILPIYNAEPFLSQCLESIENQTFKDIEVLCVNDGSTDDSLETMRSFAERDNRFIVLDKPNGGYGHSLNYGLNRAKGRYISIIEPDDFIDPKMYEELFAFAEYSHHQADVIKGSYWEYFDARSDFGECLRKPNIIREMKQTPYIFSLKEDAEIFVHHPSIWSAIYRKEFLDINNIHFVEPKGAGWADNPFLVETLVKANKIIWVPKGYYYYRQTNPNASSFLKDFHIPFDRLREMRIILNDANVNDEIWGAFYRRELDYIRSTINEFGFKENDPEIYNLIYEVLSSIDEKILRSSRFIHPEDIIYFDHFLKEYDSSLLMNDVKEEHANVSKTYDISFIVPVVNQANLLPKLIDSISRNCSLDYEIILVDCGSTDRSLVTCRQIAKKGDNIKLLASPSDSLSEGLNKAIEHVSGKFFLILDSTRSINNENFNSIVNKALADNPDISIVDPEKRFITDLMCSTGRVQTSIKDGNVTITNIKPEDIAYCLFNLANIKDASVLFCSEFISANGLKLSSNDQSTNAITLACKALSVASTLHYSGTNCIEKAAEEPTIVPFLPDLHEDLVVDPPAILPGILDAFNEIKINDISLLKSKANLLVSAFMKDLTTRCFPETLYSYANAYLSTVQTACKNIEGKDFFDVEEYYDFQIISQKGLKAYLATQFLYKSNDVKYLQKSLDSVFSSSRFSIGSKIVEKGSKILSGRLQDAVKKHFQ